MGALLALISSLGWGTSDYLGGLRSRTIGLARTLVVSQAVSAGILAVAAAIVADTFDAQVLRSAAPAGLGECVAIAALYRGLAVGSAALVAPVAAAAPIVPIAVSVTRGQRPGVLTVVAVVLVIGGLIVAAREPRDAGADRSDAKGLLYGAVSALGFGAYFTFMADASERSVPWALLTARVTSVVVITSVVVGAALVTGSRERVTASGDRAPASGDRVPAAVGLDRRRFAALALIGVLIVVGDGAYAVATTVGTLVLVAVLSATHPVVTIAWARFHGGEQVGRLRVAGIATTLVGVAVLTASAP